MVDKYKFDFGFSAVSEEELKKLTGAEEETNQLSELLDEQAASAELYKDTVAQIEQMITPLINNLMLNPDKNYIYWPNRVEKIKEFKAQLDKLFTVANNAS
jgi:F0F1-type ATP synthase delta subunit